MTLASIENRLRRIETAKRPPRGLFFVAWGATPDEIERGIEEARSAGIAATGEPVVRVPWPFGTARPPNRWARDEISHFTHTEFTALMGPVDEYLDHLADDAQKELHKLGIDDDDHPAEATEYRRTAADGSTDAVLLRAVLAKPLDGEPAPMSEPQFKRIVDCVLALSFRACIRGCDRARDQLMEAAHAPKH